MNHPLEQSLYNPNDNSINLNNIEQPLDTIRLNNNVTSTVNGNGNINNNSHHSAINIDVHNTSTSSGLSTVDSPQTVQQNFLSFLNEARSHLGGGGVSRPVNLHPNNNETAVHHHHNHHHNGVVIPGGHPPPPIEDSNVNRWRVNLNNVLSFSAGPSTETIRSWIPRTGTFRYVPLNRSSSLNSGRDQQRAAGVAGESAPAATNDVIINFSTIAPSGGVDRDSSLSINREPRTPPILTRISSIPRSNIGSGDTTPTTNGGGNPGTPPLIQSNDNNRGAPSTPPTPPPSGAAAGATAQQRNPLEIDEDNLVYELVVKVLSHFVRYLPFIGIVLLKAIYDHWLGIIDVLVLHTVVYQVNKSLCEQVTKMSQKSLGLLFRDYLLLTFVLVYRFMMAHSQPDYFGLLLNTAIDPKSLGQLLYAVAVNDLILKLITIKIKILVTALPTDVIKHKSRGRLFALIEAISQLYRSLVPVKSWMLYLLVSYTGFDIIVGMFFFSSLYMGAKAFEFVERGKFLKKAFCSFLRNVDYGRQPSKEELSEAGATCPICHDNYDTPVVLECNHIFCEVCVGTWFKREQTCPMCRAKVADDPTWQNGSTTLFYQLC
ncbi:RING finger and transmembrane domain-containing protein 2 [Episyrphus balteatus]|uniref:RING finger and transmembrane domain-containing protein 2 n=1 Tax=Episyrphus balteatus TaxID=286459 RepID=UPI002485B8FD|nr:RING finger and transmembrane domain-containing protein 2 [Episyrphus balteatus]